MEKNTKKKKVIHSIIIIVALIIILCPIPFHYKDGGTVEYKALVYSVTDYHSIYSEEGEYLIGISVEIFGIEVFDNTRVEKINITK